MVIERIPVEVENSCRVALELRLVHGDLALFIVLEDTDDTATTGLPNEAGVK